MACCNTWSDSPLWWLMNSRETNGASPDLSVSIALPTRSLLVIAMRVLSKVLFCELAATPELCPYGVVDRAGL